MDIVLRQAWDNLLGTVLAHDNHPPMYYIFAKVWVSVSSFSVTDLRWMSFLFTIITVSTFTWLYKSESTTEKFIALGILGTNPLLTYYSSTVRPYSLIVMLASLMTVCSFRLERSVVHTRIQHRTLLGLYYGSALLLGLSHYFGTLFVWIVLTGNFVTKNINTKRWFGFLVLLITVIWPVCQLNYGSVNEQAASNSWVHVKFIISTVNNFFSGVFPLITLSTSVPQMGFGAVLALLFIGLLLRPRLRSYWDRIHQHPFSIDHLLSPLSLYWLAVCLCVVVAGCFFDMVLPFTTPYYFLICLPAVSILLAKAIAYHMNNYFNKILGCAALISIVTLQIIMSAERLSLP